MDSAPVVYVAVKKNEDKISINKTLGVANGSIDISEKGSYRKGVQFNIAKGSAYFKRPQDIESVLRSTTGNKREFGNLYNPFWLPRLDSATTAELQALLAAKLVD